MTSEESVFNEYRGKRVLLDANLFLLLLIGSFERQRIKQFKRTSGFLAEDFDLLVIFLQAFRTVVTTPHVLTEVSNLANSLPEHLKSSWYEHFAQRAFDFVEIFEPAVNVMQQPSFNPFGLTDAALQASPDVLVLTEDYRLSGFLRTQGKAVLNFGDLRMIAHSAR